MKKSFNLLLLSFLLCSCHEPIFEEETTPDLDELENNMFFINKWLDEAYYTMKNIDSNYDFNISKDSMYDVVFEDMYLD